MSDGLNNLVSDSNIQQKQAVQLVGQTENQLERSQSSQENNDQ